MPRYNFQLSPKRPLGLTKFVSLVDSYFDHVWAEFCPVPVLFKYLKLREN